MSRLTTLALESARCTGPSCAAATVRILVIDAPRDRECSVAADLAAPPRSSSPGLTRRSTTQRHDGPRIESGVTEDSANPPPAAKLPQRIRGDALMTDDRNDVETHYTRPALGATILAALAAAGKDIEHLTIDDLAPVDEFHSRRRLATVELAALLVPTAGDHVLDIGSGIGGPSRYLAATFGCRVTGIDLTAEFCRIAADLARRTGLGDRVDYRQGDATSLPFA